MDGLRVDRPEEIAQMIERNAKRLGSFSAELDGKAAAVHTHEIQAVNGLAGTLEAMRRLLGGFVFRLDAVQQGSGEPAPDNPRPILPGLTLVRDDETVLEVYGGELDTASGVLTVDRAMVDLGTPTWDYNTKYTFFTTQSLRDRKTGVLNVSSDLFKTEAGSWSGTPKMNVVFGNGSNVAVYVQCPLTIVDDFLALVTGHQLVYDLATPVTYQLTEAELARALDRFSLTALWARIRALETGT